MGNRFTDNDLSFIKIKHKKESEENEKSIKSIFPDEQRKEAYWKIYADKALSYERLIIKNLQDMFNKQKDRALESLDFDKKEAKSEFKEAVEKPLSKLIEDSLGDAEELINPVNPHKTKQGTALRVALEWLKTRINWAADEVGDETQRLLSAQLVQGYELGEDAAQLARRVESVFEHCSRERAITIARTETMTASTQGYIEGYKEVGVDKLEFYTAQDERVCEDCNGLNGEQFATGNSVGVIPVHPMCRCVFLPVI